MFSNAYRVIIILHLIFPEIKNGATFLFNRGFSFCLSSWMWCDMGLDANQTISYFLLGISSDEISASYFYAAATIWGMTPLLLTLFCIPIGLAPPAPDHTSPTSQCTSIFGGIWFLSWFLFQINLAEHVTPVDKFFIPFLWLDFLPFNLLASAFAIYIVVPMAAMGLALKTMFYGKVIYIHFCFVLLLKPSQNKKGRKIF